MFMEPAQKANRIFVQTTFRQFSLPKAQCALYLFPIQKEPRQNE
jgi:hypothetical protein